MFVWYGMGLVNLRTKIHSMLNKLHVQMEFSSITPDIFVGSNACCKSHYQLLLINRGITHDISLEGELVDSPYGADSYLWLPTEDHHAPTMDALRLGCSHIDSVIVGGGKLYIHCKNGHGRAPSLVIAWMMTKGKTLKQAIKVVTDKRMELHLEPPQLEMLKEFERLHSSHDPRT